MLNHNCTASVHICMCYHFRNTYHCPDEMYKFNCTQLYGLVHGHETDQGFLVVYIEQSITWSGFDIYTLYNTSTYNFVYAWLYKHSQHIPSFCHRITIEYIQALQFVEELRFSKIVECPEVFHIRITLFAFIGTS